MGATFRAEHVGSLLRPPEVLRARQDHEQGRIGLELLREVEDRAALANIELQRETGMEVFTDGEVRRANWMAELMESIGGIRPLDDVPTGDGWRRDRGPDPAEAETHFTLSPQCGFASTAAGNLLTADDQRRKLELVVDTARRVWG